MERCPCLQKSKHWKGVLTFQDEYFKLKNSKSFISSYNESFHAGLMKQLFAPLSRSIAPDISSTYMRSSGSFRNAKSPKSQLNWAPIFMQKKLEILPAAETLLPLATIHVPTQNNGTEQSLTLPAIPKCKETNEKDVIVMVSEDPKWTKVQKKLEVLSPLPSLPPELAGLIIMNWMQQKSFKIVHLLSYKMPQVQPKTGGSISICNGSRKSFQKKLKTCTDAQ